MDKIRLNNISLYAYHGVLPEERERGQEFIITVELETDLNGISNSDDLSQTINYADIVTIVKEIVQGKPYNLIETLAEKISIEILKIKEVDKVIVTVEKPRPPLPVVSGGASVTLYRHKIKQ